MGTLYRSEDMALCQLFVQSEAAYNCVDELAELGLVQFRDLNPNVNAFQKKFVNEVRRCEEMERKLRYIKNEIVKEKIPILDTRDNPASPAPREMIDLEATFEKLENETREVASNTHTLKRNFLELVELKYVLFNAQTFFQETQNVLEESEESGVSILDTEEQREDTPINLVPSHHTLKLGFLTGVINCEKLAAFERMLWRVSRGKVFLRQTSIVVPLEDPVTGDFVYKSVFVLFFQGEQLKGKVNKICEGFRATMYPCPDNAADRQELATGVIARIEDLSSVLSQTQEHRHRVLVAAAKNIKVWFVKVRKMKAIFHTLNLFNLDVIQKCFVAECWCAVRDLPVVQQKLKIGTERSGSTVPTILNRMGTDEAHPTYFRTNKFTHVYQTIIEAYGVPTYKEVNPAPFAIISFPFLFSVMFGDFGHGMILFLFGFFMVIKEKKIGVAMNRNEIWKMFFGGRYIIMLMGLFSLYSGLLYNDCFSKSFNFFGSQWYPNTTRYSEGVLNTTKQLTLDPATNDYSGTPYQFGMDPIWQLAGNKITFQNSFKMKISVIFGFTQMWFGVILSLLNHIHFRKWLNVVCEFIPEIIFLTSIFGYLCALIFYKWIVFDAETSTDAPSLLIGLINMFLVKYPTEPPSAAPFYTGQKYLQISLLLLAVISAMVLLFVKPCILRCRHNRQALHNRRRRSREVTRGQQHEQNICINTGDDGDDEITILENEVEPNQDDDVPILTDGADHQPPQSEDVAILDPTPKQPTPPPTYSDVMASTSSNQQPHPVNPSHVEHQQDQFNFGDIFILQAIHTIEFCLNCISHTASYLRLWALSLAHAELSEVLWNMVMRMGISMLPGYFGTIPLIMVFPSWAVLTIAILLVMEGLSAFLHTLRLHWVEFQSKFYDGQGYKFIPLSFEVILNEDDDDS